MTRSQGAVGLAAAVLVSGVVAAVYSRRRGRTFQSALCATCVVLSATGLLSLYGLRREASDHHVFWLCIPAVFTMVGVSAVAAGERLGATWRKAALGAAYLMIAAFLAVSVSQMMAWHRLTSADQTTRILYDALNTHIQKVGAKTPLVQDTPATWDQAAGIVLHAVKDGKRISVSDDLVRVVGKEFARSGAEDAQFVLLDVRADMALLYHTNRPPILRTDRFAIATVDSTRR